MSTYPDGSTHPNWNRGLRVVPLRESAISFVKIRPQRISQIVCHRVNADGHEEYLVEWISQAKQRPYSWHGLGDLASCLAHVQTYTEGHVVQIPSSFHTNNVSLSTLKSSALRVPEITRGLKRKSPDRTDAESCTSSGSSASRSSPALSLSSTSSTSEKIEEPDVYNGALQRENGEILMWDLLQLPGGKITDERLPSLQMQRRALRIDTRQAVHRIQAEFTMRLQEVSRTGPPITVENQLDQSRPALSFHFISKSVPGRDVQLTEPETVVGCGLNKGSGLRCKPHMGQYMGCEYSRVCDCLEFAGVDEPRLTMDERRLYDLGETAGLPKRFPYYSPVAARPNCLVPFYLESRHPIYECNVRCNCGPGCKTRVVQRGRQVPLQIFKTQNRGWGLRCTVDLQEGQFIDTYRGEIITNEEADRREEQAASGKASYFYTLDKHVGANGLEADDCYIVDGEMMGGPTRFINHSCDPNCRQYTVSYNKYDIKVYELAFFAVRPIKAYTELTFDYLDKDDEDEEVQQNTDEDNVMACRCGAQNCRKTLWL